jgi:hypothetical protein
VRPRVNVSASEGSDKRGYGRGRGVGAGVGAGTSVGLSVAIGVGVAVGMGVEALNRGLWACVWLACGPIRAACRSNRPSVESVCARAQEEGNLGGR